MAKFNRYERLAKSPWLFTVFENDEPVGTIDLREHIRRYDRVRLQDLVAFGRDYTRRRERMLRAADRAFFAKYRRMPNRSGDQEDDVYQEYRNRPPIDSLILNRTGRTYRTVGAWMQRWGSSSQGSVVRTADAIMLVVYLKTGDQALKILFSDEES